MNWRIAVPIKIAELARPFKQRVNGDRPRLFRRCFSNDARENSAPRTLNLAGVHSARCEKKLLHPHLGAATPMRLLAPSLPHRHLLHQGLMQMIECRIFIREAPERNYHPPLLFGRLGDGQRFRRDELIWALASDGRRWHRRQRVTAEIFEARIVPDLAESAHTGCGAAVLVG